MKRLIAACGDAGILVVPEIESFGHTGYIYRHKRYAHLADSRADAGHFSGINPLHRETRAIMRDLVFETAEMFPGPYIHVGLDEVRFGNNPQVKRALRKKELWQIFADYTEFMRETVIQSGKTMMMWGDHLLSEPRIADRISKDIIICNWHYMAEVHAGKYDPLVGRGFKVVACPASNSSGDMIAPNADKLVNLQRTAWLAQHLGCIGYLNTIWCPQRMLCRVEQAAAAVAGAWANDPQSDPRTAMTRFVRGQYGLAGPSAAAGAILGVITDMPRYPVLAAMMNCGLVEEPATSDAETGRALALAKKIERHKAALVRCRAGVKWNRREYDGWLLACDLLLWATRVCTGRAIARPAPPVRALLAEGKALLNRVVADWNSGRYADDEAREAPGLWRDALVPNLRRGLGRLAALNNRGTNRKGQLARAKGAR
jgi:hypothetical protein